MSSNLSPFEKVLRRPLAKSPAQKNAGCEKADPAAGIVSDLEKIFDKPGQARTAAQENPPREQRVERPQKRSQQRDQPEPASPPAEPATKDGLGNFAKWVGYVVMGLFVLALLQNC